MQTIKLWSSDFKWVTIYSDTRGYLYLSNNEYNDLLELQDKIKFNIISEETGVVLDFYLSGKRMDSILFTSSELPRTSIWVCKSRFNL